MNPVTGVPQISFMSLEEELEIGERAKQRLEVEVGLLEDPVVVGYVQEIGGRLAAISPRQDVTYTFDVLDLEFPNAFALPGGHIYVSRGLLALVNAESELANVLGHEIGHVAARHAASGAWRRSTIGVLSGIGELAGMVVGLDGLPSAAGQGMLAAHSRAQEIQADDFGQRLATQAGFNPASMSHFLHSLDRDGTIREDAVREASFLDSHPVTVERVETTRARARELGPIPVYDRDRDRSAYLERVRGLIVGQDPRSGVFLDDRVFAHPDLDFRVRFPEGWSSVTAQSLVKASHGPIRMELHRQGSGTDPAKAARDYLDAEREHRARAEERGERIPKPLIVRRSEVQHLEDERTVYSIEGTIGNSSTQILYWVPLPGGIFRLSCTMPMALRLDGAEDCQVTAGSLQPLRGAERSRIQRVTLQLESARPNETLAEFSARTRNHWSLEWTAAVNGLSEPYTLEAGQLIKYARAEPYRSSPALATPERAAGRSVGVPGSY